MFRHRGAARAGTAAVCAVAVGVVLAVASGCASYRTPGAAADFRALGISEAQARAMTDGMLIDAMNRRPAASFPASVAAVRLQASGYRSYSTYGVGSGGFSLVSTREAETDEQIERLAALPMVVNIVGIPRMLVPDRLESLWDIRRMAATVQADMVFVYTFDTRFGSETIIPALGTITLGLFPSQEARVTTTVSGALIDTRTGFVYGTVEASEVATQLANYWTTRDATDQSRRRVEAEAFEKLVGSIEGMWTTVVARFGPGSEPAAAGVFESTTSPNGVRRVAPSSPR